MTTVKQTLRAHIDEMHSKTHAPGPRATFEQLYKWHRTEHHRFTPNHYHEGVNLGPGARPPGWRTGEGAVSVARRSY